MKSKFTYFGVSSLITLFLSLTNPIFAQWSPVDIPGFSSTTSNRNVLAASGSTLYSAYVDATPKVTVMKSTGGAWSLVGAAAFSPNTVYGLDMKVDASGVPHVVISDNAGKISVMKYNGASWVAVGTATIATSMLNQDIAIEFDNTNAPCIAFTNAANSNKLTVMKFNGSAWVLVGLSGFSSGQATIVRMKRNSSGTLYVAYQDNADLNRGRVMMFNGTAWVVVGGVSVTTQGATGSLDLGINNSGTPYLVYRDASLGQRASVKMFNGTNWVAVGTGGFSAGQADYLRIAFNSSGTPYITYRDAGTSSYTSVMSYNGTAWITIGNAGFSGGSATYTSIHVNSTGTIFVGYCDATVSSKATVMKYCTASTGSVTAVTSASVCNNGTISVSATSNSGNVLWYNAASGGSFLSNSLTYTATITSSQTYYVAAVDNNGCVSATRTAVTASVIPFATVSAASSASICSGNNAVISATPNMGSIRWYTSSTTGSLVGTSNSFTTPVLSSNTVYYAAPVNMGCETYPRTAVSVYVTPTPTIGTNGSATICAGSTRTLTASGGSSMLWSTGVTAFSITVTPTITTTYSVTGTISSATTCSTTRTLVITVNQTPTISVNSATICSGTSTNLIASGATTYSWNTGATTSSISVSPTSTTNYTVIGTVPGCSTTKTLSVLVNSSPTVAISGATICSGASINLTASGASTYNWNTGATTNSILVTPTITTTYSVTGTTGSCSNTKTVSVIVNVLPNTSVSSTTICAGSTGTLAASGASTYSWNTGATTANLAVNPTVNTNYTVTGTSTAGCVKTVTASVTVGSAPSIAANSASICIGSSTTIIASGVNTYTWNTSSNSSSITVNPTSTTVYTVSGNLAGCATTAVKVITVTVNALPVVTLANITSPLCVANASVALSGSPSGGIYSGPGVSGASFNPSVSGAGTFTVTYNYTDVNSCSAAATKTVNVSLCTSLTEAFEVNTSINIYPNPNNGDFTILIPTKGIYTIVNSIGQTVELLDLKEDTQTVQITDLAQGIYYLVGKSTKAKIVVTK